MTDKMLELARRSWGDGVPPNMPETERRELHCVFEELMHHTQWEADRLGRSSDHLRSHSAAQMVWSQFQQCLQWYPLGTQRFEKMHLALG